jgi:predicted TIM-barrel fold metal-dependent hydrolase
MDANGVDKAVIVQPICYLYDNSYVGACIKTWPSRFAAVARVDPEDINAPTHLAQLTAEGFVGVRFGPVDQSWWNAPNMLRILEKAQELRVPVLLFLGKDGGKSIPWIEPVLRKVPDLSVVIDHMADVSPSDQAQIDNLLGLAALPKVFVKISHTWALSTQDYPWMDAQHLVKTVIAKFGANVSKILFPFAKTNTREF